MQTMARNAAPSTFFKLGEKELERVLPASAFSPEGTLDSALHAVANALSLDGTAEAREMEHGLRQSFATPLLRDPHRVLGDIRRWALGGLEDASLVAGLSHLARPALPASPSDNRAHPLGRRAKVSRSVSAAQARSVLANAFLANCVDAMAPHKDPWNRGGLDFRDMLRNYEEEFSSDDGDGLAKIKCLLVYFETSRDLEGTADDEREIIFERIRFEPLAIEGFSPMFEDERGADGTGRRWVGDGIVLHENTMERPIRAASAFVNFANPNFGYGQFISSCTQEEILLMCCPEFIVGMAFIGKMGDDEVVNVRGVRRFCQYSGYLDTFKCLGPLDARDSIVQTILTLDACHSGHFSKAMLVRDLSKAYHSFREHASDSKHCCGEGCQTVSTGRWGCGAFGGLPAHKMLQQSLAANLARVNLDFSLFGSRDGCDEILAALQATQPAASTVLHLLLSCKEPKSFVADAVAFLQEAGGTQQSQVPVSCERALDIV